MKIPFDHRSRASPRKENRVWCLSPISNYFSNPNCEYIYMFMYVYVAYIYMCVHIDIHKHIYIHTYNTKTNIHMVLRTCSRGSKQSRNRHLLQPSILEGSCHRTRKRQHLGRWFSPCRGHLLELWLGSPQRKDENVMKHLGEPSHVGRGNWHPNLYTPLPRKRMIVFKITLRSGYRFVSQDLTYLWISSVATGKTAMRFLLPIPWSNGNKGPTLFIVYRGWSYLEDYFINHHKDPVIKQSGFDGSCHVRVCVSWLTWYFFALRKTHAA